MEKKKIIAASREEGANEGKKNESGLSPPMTSNTRKKPRGTLSRGKFETPPGSVRGSAYRVERKGHRPRQKKPARGGGRRNGSLATRRGATTTGTPEKQKKKGSTPSGDHKGGEKQKKRNTLDNVESRNVSVNGGVGRIRET